MNFTERKDKCIEHRRHKWDKESKHSSAFDLHERCAFGQRDHLHSIRRHRKRISVANRRLCVTLPYILHLMKIGFEKRLQQSSFNSQPLMLLNCLKRKKSSSKNKPTQSPMRSTYELKALKIKKIGPYLSFSLFTLLLLFTTIQFLSHLILAFSYIIQFQIITNKCI